MGSQDGWFVTSSIKSQTLLHFSEVCGAPTIVKQCSCFSHIGDHEEGLRVADNMAALILLVDKLAKHVDIGCHKPGSCREHVIR